MPLPSCARSYTSSSGLPCALSHLLSVRVLFLSVSTCLSDCLSACQPPHRQCQADLRGRPLSPTYVSITRDPDTRCWALAFVHVTMSKHTSSSTTCLAPATPIPFCSIDCFSFSLEQRNAHGLAYNTILLIWFYISTILSGDHSVRDLMLLHVLPKLHYALIRDGV
ncbi:unnamed protein product [Protopolystoma xenopodis]|uniref:Uncharacterized protein n=1 Tax=Protopolystoma xenopodis TaxID=117903 RepID=A0A448X2A5_9PLAT|nr:unnamed protein product [Protopolystoma xenopodis]